MARKKKRSKAQIAATKKMQRASKRARKAAGGKIKRRKGKRNPVNPTKKQSAASRRNLKKARSAKRRKKACRRAYGKRGAAKRRGLKRLPGIPKKCKTKKSHHRKAAKRSSGSGKWSKSQSRRKSHSKKSRKSAKRLPASKKHAVPGTDAYYDMMESPRKRRKGKRKSRRRNPIALANPIRHHRRSSRRHRNPFFGNPLEGPMELVSGLFGVGIGYVFADVADRLFATHALAPAGSGFTDTPAAGQIYNSESPLLPIWSDPLRLAAAAGVIFVPGVISGFIKNDKLKALKAFLQLAAYGAGARVAGKAIGDAVATFGSDNSLVLQAYGPEVAAQERQLQVGSGTIVPLMASPAGTSAQQPAGMFAGPPVRQLGSPCGGGCGGGCDDCKSTSGLLNADGATNGVSQPQTTPNLYADMSLFNLDGNDQGNGGYQGNSDGGGDGCFYNDCPQVPIPTTSTTIPIVTSSNNILPDGSPAFVPYIPVNPCQLPNVIDPVTGQCGPPVVVDTSGGGGDNSGGGTTTPPVVVTTVTKCPQGQIILPNGQCGNYTHSAANTPPVVVTPQPYLPR